MLSIDCPDVMGEPNLNLYTPGISLDSKFIVSIDVTIHPGGNPTLKIFEGAIGCPGVISAPKFSTDISVYSLSISVSS